MMPSRQAADSASDPSPSTPALQAGEPMVRALEPAAEPGWTAFVSGHAHATLYQTLAWRDVVHEVFGHRPLYLIAARGTAISGVLPLFRVKAPLLGSKLLGLPYDIGSGGPLASDAESEIALVRAAMSLAERERVDYLELRLADSRPSLDNLGLIRSHPVVISDMDLTDGEKVWSRVSTDNRQSIRKARSRGVQVREAESLADCEAFYQVYLRAFRDFGTPPYGRTYFPTVWRHLAASRGVRLLLAEVEGRTVGGLVLYCLRRNLVSKFAACLPEAVPLRAYAALYGAAIDLALAGGAQRLSWGTSATRQTGLIDFKRRWGAESRNAALYAHAVRRSPPSVERYYDETGLERRLWKKLPVGLTPFAGAILSRWFC
jgi:hypothetical protein